MRINEDGAFDSVNFATLNNRSVASPAKKTAPTSPKQCCSPQAALQEISPSKPTGLGANNVSAAAEANGSLQLATARPKTAAELCQLSEVCEEARKLLRDGLTPIVYLDLL